MAPTKKTTTKAATAVVDKRRLVKRVPYMKVVDKGTLNEDGRLTTAELENFDRTKHTAPSKTDFSDEALFLEWKASDFTDRGNALLERAAKLAKQAEEYRMLGDPSKRAMLRRYNKMQEKLAELKAQLEAEGVDE
jgi:hypothetical protein